MESWSERRSSGRCERDKVRSGGLGVNTLPVCICGVKFGGEILIIFF